MKDKSEIDLIWQQPEHPPATDPSPLSRADIVAAGIRLADDGGLADVSFRKIAAELDAGPMRLYRFIRSKDDLLELMVDEVYAEMTADISGHATDTDGDTKWRASLHRVALAYRTASFRHRWFVDLLGGRPHMGPHSLHVLETTVSAVIRAPREFTNAELWLALGAVNAYLFGAIRADVRDLVDAGAGADGGSPPLGDAAGTYLRMRLESGEYPGLRRLADGADRPDLEEDFIWGLDLVLDGLTAAPTPRSTAP